MTDKALEAAARVLVPIWYGGFEDQRQKEDGSGWLNPPGTPNARAFKTAQAVISAYLSALPGEAEVVMEQIAHKEQIGIWANELTSALSLSDFLREDWSFDDSVDLEKEVAAQLLDIVRSAITHPCLNLVASLQAMQARAEKAERERDEAREYGGQARIREQVAEDSRITEHDRAEAAEARVKELEEALGKVLDFAKATRRDPQANVPAIEAIAETALKGGSNG